MRFVVGQGDRATRTARWPERPGGEDHTVPRANDVWAAIATLGEPGRPWLPLQEIERGAVEPLPGFDEFLPGWRALLEEATSDAKSGDWESDEDRWLREVVERLDGADGLAKRAGLGGQGFRVPARLHVADAGQAEVPWDFSA